MILEFNNHNYLNTDQITHIIPNKYDSSKFRIYLSNGDVINVNNDILKDILKKLEVKII